MRASAAAEKLGVASVSIVCDGFAAQGKATAECLGMRNLPLAEYPGHPNFHSLEQIRQFTNTVLVEQIIQGLLVQPEETKRVVDPGMRDTVFTGTFEEVNQYFYEQLWGDGIPIVPPTVDKVDEFLKFTDRRAGEVIGVLLPEKRQATVWNVAVNGVMAGCRPEYMPVLLAMIESMADPKFGQEHLGHTPGTETLIIVSGPIAKELGFNYEQGSMRVGFQANTSIGRFWRLYLRNVAGFLPHKTDKASFGGTWRVAIAENEDFAARIGWETLSEDQGFCRGENVVTISSCTALGTFFGVGSTKAERILDKLAESIVETQLFLVFLDFHGRGVRPQIMLSPAVAGVIAGGGYTKAKLRHYLYEHALFPAWKFAELCPEQRELRDLVKQGIMPARYHESDDPNRLVPIVWSPDDFMIMINGDPGKDNCMIGAQNGFVGYPVSKKIVLPANWITPEAGKDIAQYRS